MERRGRNLGFGRPNNATDPDKIRDTNSGLSLLASTVGQKYGMAITNSNRAFKVVSPFYLASIKLNRNIKQIFALKRIPRVWRLVTKSLKISYAYYPINAGQFSGLVLAAYVEVADAQA